MPKHFLQYIIASTAILAAVFGYNYAQAIKGINVGMSQNGITFDNLDENIFYGLANQNSPQKGNLMKLETTNNGNYIVQFIVDLNGNIGIGTSTPNSDLHVYNTDKNAEIDIQSLPGQNNHWAIYQERTGTNQEDLRFWNQDGQGTGNVLTLINDGKILGYELCDEDQNPCLDLSNITNDGYWTLNTTRLYPNSINYNIGIGTTTPDYKLVVDGPIYLAGDVSTDRWRNINSNTFLGVNAGASGNITSQSNGNTAFGYNTLFSLEAGKNNTAFGNNALTENKNGEGNTAIGAYALNKLSDLTYSNYNTAIGVGAMKNIVRASSSTAIGYEAMGNATYSLNNIAIGEKALYQINDEDNVAIGNYALYSAQNNIQDNVAIGNYALYSTINGSYRNVAVGHESMKDFASGNDNIAVGYQAMFNAVGGNYNIAIASGTLNNNINGDRNIALGFFSLNQNQSGSHNIGVGNWSLYSNISGQENIAFGNWALASSTQGDNNIAIGQKAMGKADLGSNNIAIGTEALLENKANNNIAIGNNSSWKNISGEKNVVIGNEANYNNTLGSSNVIIGDYADYNNINGERNVMIGFESGRGSAANSKSGNIFIGYQAGYNELGSNKLYIDNSNTSNPLIGGDFYDDLIGFNGQVGIGTTSINNNLVISQPDQGEPTTDPNAEIDIQSNPGLNNHWAIYHERTTNNLNFWKNNVAILAITNSGNVGINNTIPSQELNVTGSVCFSGNCKSNWSRLTPICTYGDGKKWSVGAICCPANKIVNAQKCMNTGNWADVAGSSLGCSGGSYNYPLCK